MRSHTEIQHGYRDAENRVVQAVGRYTPEGVYVSPEAAAREHAERTGGQYVRRHVATTTYPWEAPA